MMVLAVLPGVNPFSSSPPRPPENQSVAGKPPPPPIPIPRYQPNKSSSQCQNLVSPALKITHRGTKYYRPVPNSRGMITTEDSGRSVVVGESGISYLLPGAPFEFQFSYSENPKAKPLAIREPAHLPFAPPTMQRPWTGKAPLRKEGKKKKKIPLFEPLNPRDDAAGGTRHFEMQGPFPLSGVRREVRTRDEILGRPLSRAEVRALVKPLASRNRQVNLGRDGLTHNMLELIHTHWRRQEVCKIRCLGVPTVDIDNVCYHIEGKTGGKIIYRVGGVVYLFRGRNYNHRTRPQLPIMLWKPATPVYPKLIQEAPGGLMKHEADELRKRGKNLLPICKLAKNGVYVNLVKDVREAFEESCLVKINCHGMHASDYKKMGAKLMELVPCFLLSFDEEQILMWRGNDWRSMYQESLSLVVEPLGGNDTSGLDGSVEDASEFSDSDTLLSEDPTRSTSQGQTNATYDELAKLSGKMIALWKHALDSSKALLLDETDFDPDALLAKVEKFSGDSQAREHSYPAFCLSGGMDAELLRNGLPINANDGTDNLMV